MAWKEGDKLPYDGWYNGNIKLLIANGTYEYFRPKLEGMVNNGFFGNFKATKDERVLAGMTLLEQWDKLWDEVPEEEKEKRFNVVLDDTSRFGFGRFHGTSESGFSLFVKPHQS